MTFSFGTSTQPAAGGFGAAATPAFGAPAAAAAPAFGAPAAAAPAFGAPATSAPAFGSAFGATTQSTGLGFGAAATTSAPAFGGFGGATAATSTGGFGFGGTTATSSAAPAFGGFGATPAASKPTGFGTSFGASTGFGASTSQTGAFGGFGAGATSSTGFGGFGTTTTTSTGFGAFGATGSGFGAGTGAFGATNNAFGAQNQQQQQQQVGQGQNSADGALYQSVMQCNLYNDTRDSIIARLNLLQASWGQGKAYFSNQAQPVAISQDNPLSRFKAVGYSMIPKHENADGLVSLAFSKKVTEIEAGKAQLVTSLTQVLGNKPGMTVNIENVKEAGDNSEVVITVSENVNGQSRKFPSQDLSNYLTGQAMQLKNLGVTNVYPKTGLSKSDLDDYINKPPSGVDARLWKQAVADNPDPKKLIPVPLIGFKSLQSRISAQETQNKAHCGRLDALAEEIQSLKKKQADACAALTEAKRKQAELAHRVLRVLVKQETTRKVGYTLAREEEQLFSQLEGVAAELATPTQFRGRLHELLSCVRLQSQGVNGGGERYTLDQGAVSDIRDVLAEQQRGIQALMQCVKDDFRDLDVINKKLKDD